MALTKFQHTVEFSKNKHTPSRTTYRGPLQGNLFRVHSFSHDVNSRGPHSTAPVSWRPRGAPARRRDTGCPPHLGCRSALPRLRTNLTRCQSPSPTIARP